jgi:subtilisin family serine protease
MIKLLKNCKFILCLFLFFFIKNGFSQQTGLPIKGWQNLDLKLDGVFGISLKKAYADLLKNKPSVQVIIAVIDGGVDIDHPGLKSAIWTNSNEIPGNGIDDDGNGYVDDIHGWNFMGSKKGSFHFDNTDLIRLIRIEQREHPKSARLEELKVELNSKLIPLQNGFKEIQADKIALNNIIKGIGENYPSIEKFKQYKYKTPEELKVLMQVISSLKMNPDFKAYKEGFDSRYDKYQNQINYLLNIDYDPRAGNSEYLNPYYGNPDCKGLEPSHGTHVAGIIAQVQEIEMEIQKNNKGLKIMPIRAVPDGDFLDKDLANAIRYAVDNGAKVINLSINKAISPNRKLLDEAVAYAMLKDVLIIHASGNDGKVREKENGFPVREYLNGGIANGWIEVGASGLKDDQTLLPAFSNYGKNSVDVFAPGVNIYSTWPENSYKFESGTSMAAPLVSSLAGIIRSYYPNLSAVKVKEIILKSVVKVNHNVINNLGISIPFSETCLSGGIINAFNALSLAENQS